MSELNTKNIVEAVLLASGKPLSIDQILKIFDADTVPVRDEICSAIESLQEDYAERGVELVEVGSGWRIQVGQEMELWVSRLTEEKPARYTRALLETLALIAYRQPVTRSEIEDIRGVSVSTSIMKTMQEREWVRIVGHRDVPGRPAMYGTTRHFLDYFNLKGLADLPTLMELRDLDSINAELELTLPGEGADTVPAPAADEAEPGVPQADTAVVVPVAADAPDSSETIH